ncbi:PQ-loop repeat-containing protein 1, partial [Caligus rogercresseyi]
PLFSPDDLVLGVDFNAELNECQHCEVHEDTLNEKWCFVEASKPEKARKYND